MASSRLPDGTILQTLNIDGPGGHVLGLRTRNGPAGLRLEEVSTSSAPLPLFGDRLALSDGPTVQPGQLFEATPDYLDPVTGSRLHWRIQARRVVTYEAQDGRRYPGTLEYHLKVLETGAGVGVGDLRVFLAPGVGMVAIRGRLVTSNISVELVEARWPWQSP